MPQVKGLLAGLALLIAAAFAGPAAAEPALKDLALGKEDAPVTIIEYASLTCPHCATFHALALPKLKQDYIDTGKVRLIFRDFPLDGLAARAAMLARCSGPDRYYGFLDVLFRQQKGWATSPKPLDSLAQIARLGGIGADAFNACMANKQVEDYVLKSRLQGQSEFNVTGTPTFVINGKPHKGGYGFEELKAVIDPLVAAKK